MDKITSLVCRAASARSLCPPCLLWVSLTLGLVVGFLGYPLFSLPATFCTPQGPRRLRAACLVITLTAPEGRPSWTRHDQTARRAKSPTFAEATDRNLWKAENILMNGLLSHVKHSEVMDLHSLHSRSHFKEAALNVKTNTNEMVCSWDEMTGVFLPRVWEAHRWQSNPVKVKQLQLRLQMSLALLQPSQRLGWDSFLVLNHLRLSVDAFPAATL